MWNLEVLVEDCLSTPASLGPDAVPCQEGGCGCGQCIIHGHASLHLHPVQQSHCEHCLDIVTSFVTAEQDDMQL